MLSRNAQHLQLSYPFSAAEAPRDHGSPYGLAKRRMGPPSLSHPQPVEIDPYTRVSRWEPVTLPSAVGEPNTLFNAVGFDKSITLSPEYGLRNGSRDPITEWWTGKNQPWIPKGAVPEVGMDDRPHARGYPPAWREIGIGHQVQNRPGHPADTGSVHFGVLTSDSGYSSAIGLESASTRGSDVVDHPPEIRNLVGRIPSFQPYGAAGALREAPHPFSPWPSMPTNTNQLFCGYCSRPVKNKSELKKHELRHTKPFRCTNTGCSRTEGFSTSNDLDRHMKSKHPNDCSEELLSRTYYCLVSGCKSKDKKWPRLDNFRSHLKRLHELSDMDIEHYVQRVDKERKTRDAPLPQETPSDAHVILDQEQSPCMDLPDGPDLPYEVSDSHWSHIDAAVMGAQPDMIDPILQDGHTGTVGTPSKDFDFGLDDKPREPNSLADEKALDEANKPDGCLPEQETIHSNHMSIKTMTSPATSMVDSPIGAAKSKTSVPAGKVSKAHKSLELDTDLRDVISAVLSKGNAGNGAGLDQKPKALPEAQLSDMVHSPKTSLGKTDLKLPLPKHEASSDEYLDDQAVHSGAFHAADTNEEDPIDAEQKIQELIRAICNAGYTIKKDKPVGPNPSVDQLGSGISKKREIVYCQLCPKTRRFRGRPCELKKHEKRHMKPYGCTYPKCQKTFGSKNDWKRHENSQHYQHETWRCDEEAEGKICGKVFYTADSAKAHFTKVHKVEELAILENKIAARCIGPNHQREFWCGFCEKFVSLGPTVTDPWTERFNHIDDHFMGRNHQPKRSILQWKAADPDDEEMQKKFFSHRENEKSSPDESSSSDNSSGSPNTASENPNDDTSSATLDPHKRKGTDSSAQSTRPTKQARSGKAETRIICCQCAQHYNPRTDTACTNDDHRFCNQCERAVVQLEPGSWQ